jgi:type I restriction enzyme R subunit
LPAAQPAWQLEGHGSGWPDAESSHFEVPFVYSSNSRPYLQQLAEQSGTWFRDVRSPANLARPLMDFHTPDGLLDLLTRSKAAAEAKLQQEGYAYLRLRNYQERAIQAVEAALAAGQSNCLLAMATGTGKTRTIIGLMYRFLKAERFRRILFPGRPQRARPPGAGTPSTKPRSNRTCRSPRPTTWPKLGDMAAEAETRVQVATVQAMVKRIFQRHRHPASTRSTASSWTKPTAATRSTRK